MEPSPVPPVLLVVSWPQPLHALPAAMDAQPVPQPQPVPLVPNTDSTSTTLPVAPALFQDASLALQAYNKINIF